MGAVQSVAQAAKGRWREIFLALAPALSDAIEAADKNRSGLTGCPIHGGKDNFHLLPDWEVNGAARCFAGCGGGIWPGGIKTLMEINGWSGKDATREVAEFLGIGYRQQKGLGRSDNALPKKPARPNNWLHKRTWEESVTLDDPRAAPVVSYLLNRGIDPARVPPDIRCNPELAHKCQESEITTCWPAMVSAIRNPAGKIVNFHRIYVEHDGSGKAPVKGEKKMLPTPLDAWGKELRVSGGAVRLANPRADVLAVCEGIETGLAFQHAAGIPVWAGVNLSMMETMILPSEIKRIIILVDKDIPKNGNPRGAGEVGAKRLITRLWGEGRRAVMFVPPGDIPEGKKSWDWNDVVLAHPDGDFQGAALKALDSL